MGVISPALWLAVIAGVALHETFVVAPADNLQEGARVNSSLATPSAKPA